MNAQKNMNPATGNFDSGKDIYNKSVDNLYNTGAWSDFSRDFGAAGGDTALQNTARDNLHATDSWKQYQKSSDSYDNFLDANALLYPSQTNPDASDNPNLSEAVPYNPTTTDANFTTSSYLNQGDTNITGTDLSTGIYGAKRLSTQADVDSGLATSVGQQIGNTVSLPQGEADLLSETLSDGQDAADIKFGAVDDKYSNLVGAVNDMTGDKLSVIDEQNELARTATNTLVDASDTKLEVKEGTSALLTPLEQAMSTERLDDATTASDTMKTAVKGEFTQTELASEALAQAEYDANRAKYQNVTDALRADRLGAMRRGESTTTGTGDRMRLEAEMRAAQDYANLDSASAIGLAGRTYENTKKLGSEETEATSILAQAQMQDNQTEALVAQAQRTLANVGASAEEKAEAQRIISDTQYASNKAKVKLDSKQDVFAQLSARENERLAIADELANIVQSTQEKTLPAVKLAELLIEQSIDEGNLEVKTAEEKYQAKIEKAKELLQNPSLMEEIAAQLDAEQIQLGAYFDAEQQLFVNRINNLKNIPGMINTIMENVPTELFATYEAKYGALGSIWAAATYLGIVDTDGKVIPKNAYGVEQLPENAIDSAQEEIVAVPEANGPSIGLEDGEVKIDLGL